MALKETHGSLVRDQLLAQNQEINVVVDKLKIPQGGKLARGTLVTSGGVAVGEGGEPYGIIAEEVDASAGEKEAVVYLTGEFNIAAVKAGEGVDVGTLKVAARKVGLFLKEIMN